MNKKIIYILICLIIGLSGCDYFANNISDKDVQPQQQDQEKKEESKQEDRLSKTELKDVEENINAYDIEDDFRITQDETQTGEEFAALNPQKTKQLLKEIGPKKKNTLLEEYESSLPKSINKTLQYSYYNISYDYFLVTAEKGAKIKETPDPAGADVGQVNNLDKVSLLQRVDGESVAGSKIWYRIAVEKKGQVIEGYIHSVAGKPRKFRFKEMQKAINKLKQEVAEGALYYIINYKNQNGTPPQEGNIAVDEYGYRVYHSAPAYQAADTNSKYRYVPDGMLLRILNETDKFYQVNIPTFGGDFYVPKQYIDPESKLTQLKHVVVVDDSQQNEAVFELVDNSMNLVSYNLVTTGKPGKASFKTSPGSYKTMEKKERFQYLKKDSQNIAGYAPFATRFSGGAYLHGIPVAYEEKNGEKIDPGYKEYLQTIGTFPRSSMCVRNFTSHAQFIYNWIDINNGAVIVIE